MRRRARRADRSSVYLTERSVLNALVTANATTRASPIGHLIPGKRAYRGEKGRILVVMKTVRGATRRYLPSSPFNNMPASPPVERFDVQDQVTHDSYGLGRVKMVEDDTAVIVAFGARQVRIMWPYTKLTKL